MFGDPDINSSSRMLLTGVKECKLTYRNALSTSHQMAENLLLPSLWKSMSVGELEGSDAESVSSGRKEVAGTTRFAQ
jgi:hypothetical protein